MEKINFVEAYGSLPANKQAAARQKIIKECDWKARTTFYNKMNASSGMRNWEMEKIKAVFAEYDIVVFEEKKEHKND